MLIEGNGELNFELINIEQAILIPISISCLIHLKYR